MENQRLVPPLQQCSNTPVGFGKGFLNKEQCDISGAFRYSHGLAPPDFYLFPRLKLGLKGQRFCVATDIIETDRIAEKAVTK
jgi:hypothetical protein